MTATLAAASRYVGEIDIVKAALHGRAHGADVEHVGDDDVSAHVTQLVGPSVQLAHHGADAMAVFPQGGDGRVRRRVDAAGGAGDEDGTAKRLALTLGYGSGNVSHLRRFRTDRTVADQRE